MKKCFLLLLITTLLIFTACETTKKLEPENAEKTPSKSMFFYTIDSDEVTEFFLARNWLVSWDSGEIEVPEEKFGILYEKYIGKDSLLSMLWENFFRNTENKQIQQIVTNYIVKNNLQNNPYEKALLKKFKSKKIEESEVIRYSYNDEEFDENINLFNSYEAHPFNDEFGLLLFDNNWKAIALKTEKGTDPNSFFLMCGGNTNAWTIDFTKIDNIETDEDLAKAIDVSFISNKYKKNWQLFEVEQTGILKNCGVDNYYIGFGTGPDQYIPQISSSDFVSILYNKNLKRVYKVNMTMNFSKININYENRYRLFNYLLLYSLFAYCD